MHFDSVIVPAVEDTHAMLDVVGTTGQTEEVVVRLRLLVVARRAEEAGAGDDGREVEARRRPHHGVRNTAEKGEAIRRRHKKVLTKKVLLYKSPLK